MTVDAENNLLQVMR